jgi:anthranilate phosphoribosyltransferase
MNLQPLLKRIGRGASGARSLERYEAAQLFSWLFDGMLDPAQVGAVLIALRMKGESVDELVGAHDALQVRQERISVEAGRPVVSIPTYNGARNAPNLVPLLACLLAREGVQVIVHGVRHDPGRTASAEIWSALGQQLCESIGQAEASLQRGAPAFVPIDILAPPLARMLGFRTLLGLRNTGHTVAKLLNPTALSACLRLSAYTHPEFDLLQRQTLERLDAHATVMRATEGEVVANVRRPSKIDWLSDGRWQTVVEGQSVATGGESIWPERDAQSTATWTAAVLAGVNSVPDSIAAQVQAVAKAARASMSILSRASAK